MPLAESRRVNSRRLAVARASSASDERAGAEAAATAPLSSVIFLSLFEGPAKYRTQKAVVCRHPGALVGVHVALAAIGRNAASSVVPGSRPLDLVAHTNLAAVAIPICRGRFRQKSVLFCTSAARHGEATSSARSQPLQNLSITRARDAGL